MTKEEFLLETSAKLNASAAEDVLERLAVAVLGPGWRKSIYAERSRMFGVQPAESQCHYPVRASK